MGLFSKFGFHKDQKTEKKKEGGRVSTKKRRKRKHRRRSKGAHGAGDAKSPNNQVRRRTSQEPSQPPQTVYVTRQRSQPVGFSPTPQPSQPPQTVYVTRQRSQPVGFSPTPREKAQNPYVVHRKQIEMPNPAPSNEKMTFAEYLTGVRKKPTKVDSKESAFPPGLVPAAFVKLESRPAAATPRNEKLSKSNGKEQLGTKPKTPKKEPEKESVKKESEKEVKEKPGPQKSVKKESEKEVKDKPGPQSMPSVKSDKLSEIERIKSFITFFMKFEREELEPMFEALKSFVPKSFARQVFDENVEKCRFAELEPMFEALKSFVPKSFARQIFDENVEKCRFADIICMDQTRVVLEDCASGSFIHANYVQINKEMEKNRIIVAQFPTEPTIFEFWHMIWQESISTVVNIMTDSEMKEFCDPIGLLPEVGRCRHIADGFTVTFQKMVPGSSGDFKVFVYGLIHENEYRQMCWIQFYGWPEERAPLKTDGILQVLSLTKRSRKPFVVMSLAGAGRAGTFAAIEVLHYFLHLGKAKKFDVLDMIMQVREGRFHSVQTLSQFKFIFLVLIDHLLACKKIRDEFDDDLQEKYKSIREEILGKNAEDDKSVKSPSQKA
uniref:Tyrosine-protein phosphatase domain-containing protein n=1 Tax=Panagrolaimus sp. JU765 TaxID=591449 RepID=A0AC34R4C2_9BILA